MVRIRSALPAVAVLGESELMVIDPAEGVGVGVGDGCGCCGGTADAPPPQPDSVKTNAITVDRIAAERNILPRFFFTCLPISSRHCWMGN